MAKSDTFQKKIGSPSIPDAGGEAKAIDGPDVAPAMPGTLVTRWTVGWITGIMGTVPNIRVRHVRQTG